MTEISILLGKYQSISALGEGFGSFSTKETVHLRANYISFSIFYLLVPTFVVQSSLYFLTSSHVPNTEEVRYTEKNILEKHG